MVQKPSTLLLKWYDRVKRDLPWRHTQNPYHIWLSEIMLQQTRVETVKGYYARFLERCPTVEALAGAPEQDVLKLWEGLGYYSRARNLQKAAQVITNQYNGIFPSTYDQILALPGVGPYTAGAIASIAFGERVPAVDGNVYRVASRFFGIREDIGVPTVQRRIRALVQDSIPTSRPGDYNQALMELGATLCSPHAPGCEECPWHDLCDACQEGDADSLPIHEKKQPPKEMDMAVCLMTCEGRILVAQRQERMLRGLYVFQLLEDEIRPERIQAALDEEGLACRFVQVLGEAKHVFTHRIWNMTLLHFSLAFIPDDSWMKQHQAQLVTADELRRLPMPTAMKAAREAALKVLE
ncbi:MAG: A/G-specific adenine glycosylase [Clostridiales bacterium]|nr:A/G-specific adenine glycosylase [Clostridiales bacterium]